MAISYFQLQWKQLASANHTPPVQPMHSTALTTPLHGRAAAGWDGESVHKGFAGHSS